MFRGASTRRICVILLAWSIAEVVWSLTAMATAAEPIKVVVHVDDPGKPISRYLTGACIEDVNHEIYGGIYSQMIFGESFQEPAASDAPKGFQSFGGVWRVKDGVLAGSGSEGVKLTLDHVEPAPDAVGVEVFFADATNGNAGLIVRVAKPGPGPDNFDGFEVSLDPERQIARLGWHGHNFRLIRDEPCAVPINQWIPLVVRMKDSTLEVLVDGKSVISHEHVGPLPGGQGLGVRQWQRDAQYRNLWVDQMYGMEKRKIPLPFMPTLRSGFEPSGMWRPFERGSAKGAAKIETENPFVGKQCQQLGFVSGKGEVGLINRGLNRQGLSVTSGRPYEGYIWMRRDKAAAADAKPGEVWVALESGAQQTLVEARLGVAGEDWQRFDFELTSSSAASFAQFSIKLKEPGSVVLGHAFLQPGSWGRFEDLPIRRDVTQGLIDQGITVLRYGGSMVNNDGYRWKKMIGPRDRRPPYRGLWYPYSTNGWGIIDFINLCEAAEFLSIPAFNMGESPQDMADFVEYVNGPADSQWGAKRVADGHPEPYRLRHIELGNEERVDEKYAATFKALAEAIWAKDPDMILVVGDFVYKDKIVDPWHITGAVTGITSLAGQAEILKIAKAHNREVWFDVHVDTNGPGRAGDFQALPSYCQAIDAVADGAKHAVVVFEFNAGNHSQRRALANAVGIHDVERLGLPVTTSANCLQPSGQNDNGWDQGLLFLSPSKVWLQPPGYVTQMFSRGYQPVLVKTEVAGNPETLDVAAKRSEDGRKLTVELVNTSEEPCDIELALAGFKPTSRAALLDQLAGPLDAVNTLEKTKAIVPTSGEWRFGDFKPALPYKLPPYSVTVLRFD